MAAKQAKIQVGETAPTGVSLVKGVWPGIQLTRSGKEGEADSGPTGEPWVDSNGWRILLEMAMKPQAVWVDAAPPAEGVPVNAYLIAMADAATYQGRWILTLAPGFAAEIARASPMPSTPGKANKPNVTFFLRPEALDPRLTDGASRCHLRFLGRERIVTRQKLLNMLARANQQYRVISKRSVLGVALSGLKAIVYVDIEAPTAAVRTQMLNFVEAGGLLVTRPEWQPLPGDGAVEGRRTSAILGWRPGQRESRHREGRSLRSLSIGQRFRDTCEPPLGSAQVLELWIYRVAANSLGGPPARHCANCVLRGARSLRTHGGRWRRIPQSEALEMRSTGLKRG